MDKYKKYLPFVLLILGIFILGGIFLVLSKGRGSNSTDEQLVEIPLEDRPVVTLVPKEDGHWLHLTVEKLDPVKKNFSAKSVDYELVYVSNSGTQGVPGTVQLDDTKVIERDLLLGSESSGNYRYDEGVEGGDLTLSFRDERGKLISRVSTEFKLFNGVDEVASLDGNIKFSVDEDVFVTVFNPIGIPGDPTGESELSGIFVSGEETQITYNGDLNLMRWDDNSWKSIDGQTSGGIFVISSN